MSRVAKLAEKINQEGGDLRFDEIMAAHTTFKVGGPADCWLRPASGSFAACAARLFTEAARERIPVFVLGGGANVVVSDRGIRGIVLDTGSCRGESTPPQAGGACGETLSFGAGTAVDEAVEAAAAKGLDFSFFAGMPGTIGGGIWMNARAYDHSFSDFLSTVTLLSRNGEFRTYRRTDDFGYKRSPFQSTDDLILGGTFALPRRATEDIRLQMARFRADREAKGQYRFPSAGSAFKNNRAFGKPAGKIIDELGLRGFRIGGAEIAPWHGNIIINRENARAEDIKTLCDEVRGRVKRETGFTLECEILFAGEW
ncbi:MAG: UDP-N-acetylmuramate dehydrogenase [Treponema sp.]|jgi:UDP-N-acetylmuramate dehydrogenase|nr:UDP-N-acetylmuramate dehydrogenase [Treponema sp.]